MSDLTERLKEVAYRDCATIRRAIVEDTTALNDTFWMPDDIFKGGTVVDYIDTVLSPKET